MDDLELLLSLQDEESLHSGRSTHVNAENVPNESGPSAAGARSGYCSDEDEPSSRPIPNMSVFKGALGAEIPMISHKSGTPNNSKPPITNKEPLRKDAANSPDVEVHSGLRIKNLSVSSRALSDKLADMRFIRLQSLKTAAIGDGVKGAWATIGVISEKGPPRVASNGKNYGIWKLTSLDKEIISLFLFGDAYRDCWKESVGSIVTIFEAAARLDKRGSCTLTISKGSQLLVLGTSIDFAICNGKRKDGESCTNVIDRRKGNFCSYHATAPRNKFGTKRLELTGGVLSSSPSTFRITQQKPSSVEESVPSEPISRVRPRSSSELSELLKNPDKLTTRFSSQGLRFLASITGSNVESKDIADKKQKIEVSKVNKAERQSGKKAKVIELDFDVEDDATVQAMAIFSKRGQ